MSDRNPKTLAALVIGAALIIIAGVYVASGAKRDAAPEQAATPAEQPMAAAPAEAIPADSAAADTTATASTSATEASASPFTFHETPRDLPATVFKDAADTEQTLSKYTGKVLVVNFWATWCAPCVKEMPTLDALQAKMGGDGFQVLTISQDREGAKIAKPFVDKNQWTHLPLYTEPMGRFSKDAKLMGLPTSIIIDKTGHEVARVEGELDWNSPAVEKVLRDLMAKS